MRLFFAIDVPGELFYRIYEIQNKIKELGDFRLALSYHITLKFIGDYDYKKLIQAMKNYHYSIDSFDVSVSGVSTFPNVVFLKAESKVLQDLHSNLDEYLFKTLGIPKDSRAFIPHITLARGNTLAIRNKIKTIDANFKFKFSTFALYNSDFKNYYELFRYHFDFHA